MKHIKVFTFVLGVSLFWFGSMANVFGATLNISKPESNQRVTGEVEIRWSVFNTNISDVPFDLSVMDSSCNGGFSVAGSRFAQTTKNGYYSHKFNSRNGSDGRKCIRLCVFDTSQCTYKFVEVVNTTNQAPKILNYPTQLNFDTTQVFKHTIEYMDPENDPSSLVLLEAPNFIVLEQNGLNTIGQYFVPGSYRVSFMAIDNLGASTQQSFVINVVAAPTPTPSPTPRPSVSLTPIPTKISKGFEILSPKSDSIFSGIENSVEWSYGDMEEDKFGKITLSYSPKGKNDYKEIYTTDDYQINEYKWDVSSIEPGEYAIRFVVMDSDNKEIVNTIVDSLKVEKTSGQDPIVIDGFMPPNKSEIENTKPEIGANYKPSQGATINQEDVKIELNNKNITSSCSINESGFKCSLDKDLNTGSHKVEVQVKDSNEQEAIQSWTFVVVDPNVGVEEPDDGESFWDMFSGINIDGIGSQYLYLCCGIILLIALFVFVMRTLGQKKTYDKEVSNFNSTNDYSTPSTYDSSSIESEPYDFSVGKYDVVGESEPVSSSVPPIQTTSSTDIPDWLKGDAAYGANPIDSSGNPIDMKGQDSGATLNDQSQVHESFDLAKASYGDDDSKSS